ncbi:MAG: hypothetical protein JST35_12980 [Armatimonadetes bacterium]|nr:hypothetical protein [Armatimonadota bacterium]
MEHTDPPDFSNPFADAGFGAQSSPDASFDSVDQGFSSPNPTSDPGFDRLMRPDPPQPGMLGHVELSGRDPMDRPMSSAARVVLGCGTLWIVGVASLFVGSAVFIVSKIWEVQSKMGLSKSGRAPLPTGDGTTGSPRLGPEGVQMSLAEYGAYVGTAFLIGILIATLVARAAFKRGA